MQNKGLIKDYVIRSQKRMLALAVLLREESWADVVREAQEVVELILKALLRSCSIEAPRTHDVSGILAEEKARLPSRIQKDLAKIIDISKELRRDRELAFYGSEDLTPSEFYSAKDGKKAYENADWLVKVVGSVIKIK